MTLLRTIAALTIALAAACATDAPAIVDKAPAPDAAPAPSCKLAGGDDPNALNYACRMAAAQQTGTVVCNPDTQQCAYAIDCADGADPGPNSFATVLGTEEVTCCKAGEHCDGS